MVSKRDRIIQMNARKRLERQKRQHVVSALARDLALLKTQKQERYTNAQWAAMMIDQMNQGKSAREAFTEVAEEADNDR